MKLNTVKKAREYMEIISEAAKRDGINLNAYQPWGRGEWSVFLNGEELAPAMSAEGAAYTMHALWLYIVNERAKKKDRASKSVNELTSAQLQELKRSYYCDVLHSGADVSLDELQNVGEVVSDSEVKDFYREVAFVNDDFFCSSGM